MVDSFEEFMGMLGAAEQARYRAVLDGRRVCPDHPLEGPVPPGGCRCRRWPVERRAMDASEARQRAVDDRRTGLTAGQREALAGAGLAVRAVRAAERMRGAGV
jgi:hypothetical protein